MFKGSNKMPIIVVLLALLIISLGTIFGYQYYFVGESAYKTTTIGNLTAFESTAATYTPPEIFVGGTYTAILDNIRLEVTISNSTVKVGDVLWARFNLYGTESELENILKVTIINFKGEKVDEFGILLPRPTTAPGEERIKIYGNFTLILWHVRKLSPINMEIVPGNYTIILESTVEGKELTTKIPIKIIE